MLKTTFEFGDRAAHLYAETMLGSDSDNSASIVRTNAERLIGTWRATGGSSLADLGYGGNALSSTIEEWNFTDDMTYSYRLEKQTSIMSPYGSMVRPSSTSESGMWAPPIEPVRRSTSSCSVTGRMVGRLWSTGAVPTTTDRWSVGSTSLASCVPRCVVSKRCSCGDGDRIIRRSARLRVRRPAFFLPNSSFLTFFVRVFRKSPPGEEGETKEVGLATAGFVSQDMLTDPYSFPPIPFPMAKK